MIVSLPAQASPIHAPPAIHFGHRSFILLERGRRHHWEGEGSLSIKSFSQGRALYDVGQGRYAVEDDRYLILNHSQHYAITVDAPRPVDSFCLFFAAGFAEEVQRSMNLRASGLLDEPEQPVAAPLHFYERTYVHDDILSPALRQLRAALAQRQTDYGWLQEQFHLVAERLLQVHRRVDKEIEALPALRAATRQELYRRLHRARDYMHASLHRPLLLEELARVACLSPNHFLRTFRQAFRQTPHQYLTDLRLRKAKELLRRTECPITEVCAAVGFASLGSFSWLFHRRLSVAPETYRRQKR